MNSALSRGPSSFNLQIPVSASQSFPAPLVDVCISSLSTFIGSPTANARSQAAYTASVLGCRKCIPALTQASSSRRPHPTHQPLTSVAAGTLRHSPRPSLPSIPIHCQQIIIQNHAPHPHPHHSPYPPTASYANRYHNLLLRLHLGTSTPPQNTHHSCLLTYSSLDSLTYSSLPIATPGDLDFPLAVSDRSLPSTLLHSETPQA